jgi:endoglucanase
MTKTLSFLKELISAPGLSGHETPIRQLIENAWKPLADEIEVSRLGSLHALHRGKGPEPRPKILFAAHMDAIGLMVTSLEEGLLRVTMVGGIDPRILPGQPVTVHGREELPGVIVQPPLHLLPPESNRGSVPINQLFVDTGLLPNRVQSMVRIGDLISFAQPPLELQDGTLVGHTLDNRASVAALTECLMALQDRPHVWDVWAVATVSEEENLAGAFTSAFQLQPDLAVALDVTFGSGPDTPSHQSTELGKAPVLGWGPNIHPKFFESFKDVCERLEISFATDVVPRHSGTDAYALQVVAGGIPTMLVEIPLRYMHTPVEMVVMKDISRTGRLLAEFVVHLDDHFMDTLSYDEK